MKKILLFLILFGMSSLFADNVEMISAQPIIEETKTLTEFDRERQERDALEKQLSDINYDSLGSGYIIGALLAIVNRRVNGNNITYPAIATLLLAPTAFVQIKHKNNPIFYKDPINYYPYFFSALAASISFLGFSFMFSKVLGVNA